MRRVHHLALLAFAALAPTWLAISAGEGPAPRIASARAPIEVSANGEYLIQFSSRAAQRSLATAQLRTEGVALESVAPSLFISLATLTPEEAAATASTPGVVAVDPNGVLSAADDQPAPPWGLDRSDQSDLPLDNSFTYPASAGSGTTVYIIDSGINSVHTEFTGRLAAGYDGVQDGRGTDDCYGHGTHVAGTAAGTTYGFAKAATIVPVRVLDCSGNASLADVIGGIDWVIAHHISGRAVANMSIGGDTVYLTLDNAIDRLIADGVAVAVAAGNNSSANACTLSPARAPAALTVGATTILDSRSSFSNIGSCVDLFAPGSNIVSAWKGTPTATNVLSGTSMATPHVAGALAVLWTEHPALNAAQVQSLLVASATRDRLTNVGTGSPNLVLFMSPPLPLVIGAASNGTMPAQRCAIDPDC